MDSIRTLFPLVAKYADEYDARAAHLAQVRAGIAEQLAASHTKPELIARVTAKWGKPEAGITKADLVEDLADYEGSMTVQGRYLSSLTKDAEGELATLTSLWYEIRSTRESLMRAGTRLVSDTNSMLQALEHGFVREPNVSKDGADVDKYSALMQYQASVARNLVHGNETLVGLIVSAVAEKDHANSISLRNVVKALREEDERQAVADRLNALPAHLSLNDALDTLAETLDSL